MKVIAYTDGSFKSIDGIGGVYAGACLLVSSASTDPVVMSKADNNPDYVGLRNVAGEITAVMMACEHCLNQLHMKQNDLLIIRHDYVGLDYWTRSKGTENYWRAKTPFTILYRDYMNRHVKTTFQVQFEHVKAHSSDVVNNAVDAAAKKAIDNFVLSKRKLEGLRVE